MSKSSIGHHTVCKWWFARWLQTGACPVPCTAYTYVSRVCFVDKKCAEIVLWTRLDRKHNWNHITLFSSFFRSHSQAAVVGKQATAPPAPSTRARSVAAAQPEETATVRTTPLWYTSSRPPIRDESKLPSSRDWVRRSCTCRVYTG